jgi:hypothetical protein
MFTWWQGLLGTLVGGSFSLLGSWVALRGPLRVERIRAERLAIADLMTAAFEFDASLVALAEIFPAQIEGQAEHHDFLRRDDKVRTSGRQLQLRAYFVADADLRSLGLALATVGFGQRALVDARGPGGFDLEKVRAARDAVATRTTIVLERLALSGRLRGRLQR